MPSTEFVLQLLPSCLFNTKYGARHVWNAGIKLHKERVWFAVSLDSCYIYYFTRRTMIIITRTLLLAERVSGNGVFPLKLGCLLPALTCYRILCIPQSWYLKSYPFVILEAEKSLQGTEGAEKNDSHWWTYPPGNREKYLGADNMHRVLCDNLSVNMVPTFNRFFSC